MTCENIRPEIHEWILDVESSIMTGVDKLPKDMDGEEIMMCVNRIDTIKNLLFASKSLQSKYKKEET